MQDVDGFLRFEVAQKGRDLLVEFGASVTRGERLSDVAERCAIFSNRNRILECSTSRGDELNVSTPPQLLAQEWVLYIQADEAGRVTSACYGTADSREVVPERAPPGVSCGDGDARRED